MIHPHIPHYFSHHITRETKEIYIHALLFNLALTMAYIFEPIFLYRLGYSLVSIMQFYAVVYVAYAILVFWGAKAASKIGCKHSILISMGFYILYWIALYQIRNYELLFFAAPILFALQKSFFWPAYNTEVALSEVKQQRGREVGALFSLVELATIVGPFFGGWLLAAYGFKVLFFTSGFLVLLSTYPLFKTPDIYSRHNFGFKDFGKVFKKFHQNFFGYWGFAEDLMLMTLWPIVIFTVVSGLFYVGVISTFASLIAIVLMLYVGKLADRLSRKDLIQLSALYYGLTWVFRFFANTVGSVLAFDILGRTGKGMNGVSMVSLTYDIAGSKGPDHAIAYVVFYEFSLSIGKIFAALGAIFILELTGSIGLVFVFTGILTMFYGLLKK